MDLDKFKNSCYVPYSQNASICVVKSVKGNYFPGVRVENVSFPLTINAVQNALFTCLSENEQPKAIYVPEDAMKKVEYWRQEFNVWVYAIDELGNIPFKRVTSPIEETDVKEKLEALLDYARTPNSNFPVSAVIETELGLVAGVNIECQEWNLGLCAERIAIAKAFAYGATDLKALHLMTRDGEFSSPCGACRQVIIEHMPHNPVHLHHADGTHSMHFSSDLLPHSFRSSALTENVDHNK